MSSLSRRTRELGTENAFVVLGEVGQLVAQGKDIVSFCIGQPDFPTPENIRMAGIKAITDGKHGYTPSPGIPELRAAVAASFSKTGRRASRIPGVTSTERTRKRDLSIRHCTLRRPSVMNRPRRRRRSPSFRLR